MPENITSYNASTKNVQMSESLLHNNQDIESNGGAKKSSSRCSTVLKAIGVTVAAAGTVLAAGYLIRHYAPITELNNWLNGLQGNNADIADRDIAFPNANTTFLNDTISNSNGTFVTNGTLSNYTII